MNNTKTKKRYCKYRTLHLNLKRKWFDMILSGEKTEEYRAVSGYWFERLMAFIEVDGKKYFTGGFRQFDTITFSNGYALDRDQFVIQSKDIEFGKGFEKWGAEHGKKYFVLKLGRVWVSERS